MHKLTLISLLFVVLACGSSDGKTSGEPADSGAEEGNLCDPAEETFVTKALPILESKCGKCHGETPQFGAPMSLLTHQQLVSGVAGERYADKIVKRLQEGTMPPIAEPELSDEQLDTLVAWASCGLEQADPAIGLVSSADEHSPGESPPVGATPLDLTAGEFAVPTNAHDLYKEFDFSNVVQTDMFIRRIEPIVDDSRVLHHITLTYVSGEYLYAWAPGGNAIDLGDGGMRIRPSDQFTIEIHYNNGAGVPDVVDSSGVRVYLSESAAPEYVMLAPTTFSIAVPAHSEGSADIDCVATSDFSLHLGMPHMHEIGSNFVTKIVRTNGSEETVISLSGWTFDAQRFYEYEDTQLNVGDHLKIHCGYFNYKDSLVTAGLGTTDEMCFDFIYATSPAALNCN